MGVRKRADPTSPDFSLANWPFYHMNLSIRSYEGEMRRLLRSSRLDVARWRILMIAHERQPVSVSEMAEQTIMEPSTVMRAMQRLQKDGLIQISTRATDGRVSEAVLTPRGEEAMGRVLKAAGRVFQQAFGDFEDAEIERLISLLRRVHGALRTPIDI